MRVLCSIKDGRVVDIEASRAALTTASAVRHGHLAQRTVATYAKHEDHLAGLNDEQIAAVTARSEGCVRVMAGPGSGKTRVLTHRVAHLILKRHVAPYRILCITFTKKASEEIKARLKTMLTPKQAAAVKVYTFHRFASALLRDLLRRKKDEETGRNPYYKVANSTAIIRRLLQGDSQAKREKQLQQEQRQKQERTSEGSQQQVSSGSSPQQQGGTAAGKGLGQEYESDSDDDVSDDVDDEWVEQVTEMVQVHKETQMQQRLADSPSNQFVRAPGRESGAARAPWVTSLAGRYEAYLRKTNQFDFADLGMHPVRLLMSDPNLLEEFRERYEQVLVDEFQDTDVLQYALVCLLTSHHQHIFVVGDMDQAIYGFRGASPEGLQSYLDKDFSVMADYQLCYNYRSDENIILLSSLLMSLSTVRRAVGDKGALSIRPVRPASSHPHAARFVDEWDEAYAIAATIEALGHPSAPMRLPARQAVRRKWSDFAVLYRTNAQASVIATALENRGIPYRWSDAAEEDAKGKRHEVERLDGHTLMSILRAKPVGIVVSYIRAILNPADTVSLQQAFIGTKGYGVKTWEALEEMARERDCCIGMVLLDLAGKEPKERPSSVASSNWSKMCAFARLFSSLRDMAGLRNAGSKEAEESLFNRRLFDNIFKATAQCTSWNHNSGSSDDLHTMSTSSGSGSGSDSNGSVSDRHSDRDAEQSSSVELSPRLRQVLFGQCAEHTDAVVSSSACSTSAELSTPVTRMDGVLIEDTASSSGGSSGSNDRHSSSTEKTEGRRGEEVAKNLKDFIVQLLDRTWMVPHLVMSLEYKASQRLLSPIPADKDDRLREEDAFNCTAEVLGVSFTDWMTTRVSDTHDTVSSAMAHLLELMTEERGRQVSKGGPNAVRLMTIHKAKGLEFPVVFIAGVEDGILPLKRSDNTEEERRVLYVGMTRAEDKLFMSCCSQRRAPYVDSDSESESDSESNDDLDDRKKWRDVEPSPFLVVLMGKCKGKELNATWQHLELITPAALS